VRLGSEDDRTLQDVHFYDPIIVQQVGRADTRRPTPCTDGARARAPSAVPQELADALNKEYARFG
jgi:hypothetical protein